MEPGKRTCLICLRNNYDDSSLILFDMCTLQMENLTYLNKLEIVLNAEIVVYDSTLICRSCLDDLNNAYDFKERVNKALQYWSVRFEEGVNNAADIIISNEIVQYTEVRVIENRENNTELCVLEQSNTLNDTTALNNNTEPLNNDNNENNLVEPSTFDCYKCNNIFLTASEIINHSCGLHVEDNHSCGGHTVEDQIKDIPSQEENKCVEEKESDTIQCRDNRSCDSHVVEEKVKDVPPREDNNKCVEEKESATFHCTLCKLEFTTQKKLNQHTRDKHQDSVTKKFICSYCNHAFKQSYHLREHLTSHTGEHNFMCSVCGKTFQRISSQKRHMKTHEALPGEKAKKSPFLCNICGKRFPYSNGAQRHMRIHTGERRYECKVCSKKFSQTTHLKVHLRTHTGEKPYICDTCGESFTLKVALHKHTSKGHDESNEDIEVSNIKTNLSQSESIQDEKDTKNDEYLSDDILYDP